MAEDWNAIAAEINDAIASVGFTAALIRRTANPGVAWKPASFSEQSFDIVVIDDKIRIRNADGTLTGENKRILTISALNGVIPTKDDLALVRGTRFVILDVLPIAPGGVDLLFDIELGGPDGAP